MKRRGALLLWGFLGAEIMIFFFRYATLPNGYPYIKKLLFENTSLEQDIKKLTHDIEHLQQNLMDWHNYPYYQEKIAREQLHMARQDEVIYYTS